MNLSISSELRVHGQMAKRGKVARERNTRNKVQLKKKGSDESDEDYMVSEDEEFEVSEDEYCSSLADDETEESVGGFEDGDEEEEWEEKKIKAGGGPRGQKSYKGRSNNGAAKSRSKKASDSEEGEDYEDDDIVVAKRRKRSMPSHKEKEGNDFGVLQLQEVGDVCDKKLRKKTRLSSTENNMDNRNEKSRKKTEVSYREEKEDGDCDDSNEDNDEEFRPDEVDVLSDDEEFRPDEVDGVSDEDEFRPDEVDGVSDDEEFRPDEVDGVSDDEELLVAKKNKVNRLRVKGARIANRKGRKKISRAMKRTKRKKPIKEQVSRGNNRYSSKEFRDEIPVVRKRKKTTEKGRRRIRSRLNSDSDFVSSSDHEYTISEEEREQIREASQFCRRPTTNLWNSSSLKTIEEEKIVPSRRKHEGRKGKEKVVDMKIEVGKQVCGICLSEEGKRTVKGILNCCSHYFCFACIMEWSKVETRCPLCKQRFTTISKTARVDGGHDSRDAVISVPERDQVLG